MLNSCSKLHSQLRNISVRKIKNILVSVVTGECVPTTCVPNCASVFPPTSPWPGRDTDLIKSADHALHNIG